MNYSYLEYNVKFLKYGGKNFLMRKMLFLETAIIYISGLNLALILLVNFFKHRQTYGSIQTLSWEFCMHFINRY